MKGQVIGDSVFSLHDGRFMCGVGISPHGKAVIEERRKKVNSISIGYYCAAHADSQRRDARAQRDLADKIRRAELFRAR